MTQIGVISIGVSVDSSGVHIVAVIGATFLGAKVPDQARPAVDDVEVKPSQPSSTVSSS